MSQTTKHSPQKRRHQHDEHEEPHEKRPHSHQQNHPTFQPRNQHATVVAEHYNKRRNVSCAERKNSKIYYMRNFNNWTKSVLIKKYLDLLRLVNGKYKPVVLDLGCGKGGDLLKWNKGNIQKMICTDIAGTSVSQCEDRYKGLQRKSRHYGVFDAEFVVNDSGKESLRSKFQDPDTRLDITSCQFVIHYTFESEAQADRMVQNACESLKDGGYFIGTTVNSDTLMRRLKESKGLGFGNDVCSVTFESRDTFPDFGCRYRFQLHDVVDCPEFLLKKDNLVSLCRKYGMRLVEWKTFAEFFEDNSRVQENRSLIKRMEALEEYPPRNGIPNSPVATDYDHAEEAMRSMTQRRPGCQPRVATLSKTEWDAANIYCVYAFVKDPKISEKPQNSANNNSPASSPEKIPLIELY